MKMKKLQLLAYALAAASFTTSFAPMSFAQSASESSRFPTPARTTYLVTFVEPGLMYNEGQNRAYAATALSVTGARKLNTSSFAAANYLNFLRTQQDSYLARMSSAIGRSLEPLHRYEITENGIAVSLTEAEFAIVKNSAGIKTIKADEVFQINTDAGPRFIGAPSVWSGSAISANIGTRGQGVLVGVFDSGVNLDHPSFASTDGSCGFSPGNPKLVAAKDCNTANCATGNGEDVSIFVDANNPGSSGHGVHTASTVLGSVVSAGTLVNGVAARYNISGVAPCAKVITYKICGDTLSTGFASCNGSAIQAAIQTSIVDQVDVVNFSVSGGTNPWSDNDRGFLDMLNADILVSASAGNTRAAPNDVAVGAVNHRGPWVMTVANSTHDRGSTPGSFSVAGSLQNLSGVDGTGPVWPIATINAQVAVASVLGNELGCVTTPFPAGSMTGKIALISRGTCTFLEKAQNAANAGAVAMIVYNNAATAPGIMGNLNTSTIPAVMIAQADGIALRDFLTANTTAAMTASGPQALISVAFGDILNASSLKGPNIIGTTMVGSNTYIGTDTTKPDITGPGTNIYAAFSDNFGQFGFLTGTSMSAPHLAGAATLLRALNPTWTPSEVKSAIMLTATVLGKKPDNVTAWDSDDVGSGRVDLSRAARSGLLMDETFARYLAANPATTGNQELVRQLNVPSLRNTQVTTSYTFTRTFRNALTSRFNDSRTWSAITTGAPAGTTVSVTPSTFTLGAGVQTQIVQITVTINQANAALRFGEVSFVPSLPQAAGDRIFGYSFEGFDPVTARLPIVIQGTP
jgi:subtilisin family serine protease